MSRSLYELGETIPLGRIPKEMYALVIRQDRFGEPAGAFRTEVVDVPAVGRGQVLVYVMAAGINYNNAWAASGKPVDVIGMRQKLGATEDFHIGGSEGSGVVWAIGDGVRGVRPGDQVMLSSAQWDEGGDEFDITAWGYESNYGSFAQFCLVNEAQCHPKPKQLSWETAACSMVSAPTAYRQLFGWAGNTVRPGDPVLIWGGAGGLGSMAIQLTRMVGGIPVAVVSDESRRDFCFKLGAEGVIDRRDFDHWGRLPDVADKEGMDHFLHGARAFGRAIWDILGARSAPRIVFEHSGEATIPTSMYVCANGGMVVICGGTSGYNGDVDLRHLWMRSKRLQGSHASSTRENREVARLVASGLIDPCMTRCGGFEEVGDLHQMMHDNTHIGGNMCVLVNAPERGLNDF